MNGEKLFDAGSYRRLAPEAGSRARRVLGQELLLALS